MMSWRIWQTLLCMWRYWLWDTLPMYIFIHIYIYNKIMWCFWFYLCVVIDRKNTIPPWVSTKYRKIRRLYHLGICTCDWYCQSKCCGIYLHTSGRVIWLQIRTRRKYWVNKLAAHIKWHKILIWNKNSLYSGKKYVKAFPVKSIFFLWFVINRPPCPYARFKIFKTEQNDFHPNICQR